MGMKRRNLVSHVDRPAYDYRSLMTCAPAKHHTVYMVIVYFPCCFEEETCYEIEVVSSGWRS